MSVPFPSCFPVSLQQARKTFQKLIYVSTLVFGDRQAAFLLPWSRVFGLNDAQVRAPQSTNEQQACTGG